MTQATILGWYGKKNAGDEAILSSIISSLRSEIPDIKVVVLSYDPSHTAEKHKVKAIYYGLNMWPKQILKGEMTLYPIVKEIHKSDIFIFGGGGLLKKTPLHTYFRMWLDKLIIAKIMNKPIMVYGIGAVPTRNTIFKLILWFTGSLADIITVRDETSERALRESGISKKVLLTADPAFNLKSAPAKRVEIILKDWNVSTNKILIGVCLRHLTTDESLAKEDKNRFDAFKTEMANALDEISTKLDAEIIFIPLRMVDPDNDAEVAEQIAKEMVFRRRVILMRNEFTPEEINGIINRMDLVISARLHALIFASAANKPMVAINYDPKVRGIMRTIEQEEYTINTDRLDKKTIVEKTMRAWNNRTKIKENLALRVKELQKKEELNKKIAVRLIERRKINTKIH